MNKQTNKDMAAKIFRINYKSDFILTLESDAGWMTPFCIKFWTGAPSLAYFVGWDGETYTHCAYDPSEPSKLTVQFDDHHLPIGDLKYQVAYHFTVADFPNDTEDEVMNQASITTEMDGETYQVMLDFNGETAPEIQFALPAYANEAQRIANEEQRIANEQQRIRNEETRIDNEQTRINQESARVNEYAELKADAVAATGAANDAAALANQKAGLADDAATLATQKAGLAGDAATLATQKAGLADDAATLATQKAGLADDAATLATQKAGLADDAATLATQKAGLADDAATLATQKAQYAQDEGDYAKAQGDYAKSQADKIPADVMRTASDATFVNADHEALFYMRQANATLAGLMTSAEHNKLAALPTDADLETGIIYDVSALHPTSGVSGGSTYASLSAALAVIPQAKRKGGMTVKFVQSSDNKYVEYFLKKNTWSASEADWEKVNLEEEVSQLGQYSNEETRYTDLNTDEIYNLNVSVGKIPTLTPGTTPGWSCVSFSVNAGDIVKIKAIGNVYSGRPYAILSAEGVVLKSAKDDGVSVVDTEMVMPEGAKTFYANFKEYDANTQGVWKYVALTVKQKIAEVDTRSISNTDKIENIYGYFDVRNWVAGYFYQADVRIGEGYSVNYECCKVPTRGLKEIHFSVSCPISGIKCTLVDTEFNILEQWTGNVNEDIYLSEYPDAAFLYVSNNITNTDRFVRVVPSQSNPLITQLERIKVLGALPFSYSNPSSSGYLPANYINPLCFLHISDTHWHAGYVNTVKNAVELLNSIKLNQMSRVATREILRFLIHTGDVVSDRFTDDFDHYKNAVLGSTKPCFLVIGNHDVGGSHKDIATSGTDAQVFEKMIEPFLSSWNLNNDGGGIAHPDGKCYYFNDFTTEKIRMIVLDAYETNFEIIDGQLTHNRGDNGYTQNQITWFGNALAGTPAGYGVIVAKHAPCGTIGTSESPFNSSADFGASYEGNNDFIPAIVQAFKNGDNLSLNPISATFEPTGEVQCATDFSQKSANVEFICHLNGHTHKDHAYYVPNYPTQLNLGVGCDSTYSTIDADTAHVEGTLSENLINAYAIDRNKGVVRIVRLGADISFEFQDRRFTQIPYRI